MPSVLKKLSLGQRSLRYKLRIAVYLMSVLPLLVSAYLVTHYIFPQFGIKFDVVLSLAISVFIAGAGFFIIKEVFDRVLTVTSEAKMIAGVPLRAGTNLTNRDELGDLSDSLHELTQRVHTNMDELKKFSKKTTEINIQIQERVFVLSSLLQISSMISQGEKLENILKLTVQKARLLASSDIAYLLYRDEEKPDFYMRVADGMNAERLLGFVVQEDDDLFANVIRANKPCVIDAENPLALEAQELFQNRLKAKNTLALPVYLKGRITAIIGIGNSNENFVYGKEDTELLDIFAKQIAIAVENDLLIHRLEKLEIKDPLTGLYNKAFILNRLQEEIRRAIVFKRPCAFIILDIDNFKTFHQNFGSLQTEAALKKITSLIKGSVTEVDHVGRTGDDEFSVLLPEKNKRKAQEVAEEIRKKIEFVFSEEADLKRRLTLSGGVSENPLDGISADELITAAKEALGTAKAQGRNRIIGIKEPPVCQ